MSDAIEKKRAWRAVLYPESLPEGWRDEISNRGLKWCCILHDKDKDENGELLKPHYHAIFTYRGAVSDKGVARMLKGLGQPSVALPCDYVPGAWDYLVHKNEPEKFQYDLTEIETFNGFNILDFSTKTRSEILAVKSKVFELIDEKGFYEYCDLVDFLRVDETLFDEFECVICNTLLFDRYIASRRYKRRSALMKNAFRFVTSEGEVIEGQFLDTE